MDKIQIFSPGKVVFGSGSLDQFFADFHGLPHKRLYLVTLPHLEEKLAAAVARLNGAGIRTRVNTTIAGEPTFEDFERLLLEARAFEADSVVGIGGGSVMDTAKLVAAQLQHVQTVDEVLAEGFKASRLTYLACVPTTAGTGSEVSPNAIFVNSAGSKVGVISPELVPDAAYVDPLLTASVPPSVTAATGIDALAHCMEAYTGRHAHPVVDLVALEGIKLIGRYLQRAYDNGNDEEARSGMALGSMYGGMCLGPVNTAAAHALAYPLSTEFHVPHGLSVALLLPYIMEYNLEEVPDRYAAVAVALGSRENGTAREVAKSGVAIVRNLIRKCGLPLTLAEVNLPFEAAGKLVAGAMQIGRLLRNNPRSINAEEARKLYTRAFNKQEYEENM